LRPTGCDEYDDLKQAITAYKKAAALKGESANAL
jgi:hypothetical protein